MPLFLPLLPFLKLLSSNGLTAINARNVAMENHKSCPSMPDERQLATAAAAEPTAKQIITKPDVKISTITRTRASITQICQVSIAVQISFSITATSLFTVVAAGSVATFVSVMADVFPVAVIVPCVAVSAVMIPVMMPWKIFSSVVMMTAVSPFAFFL